MQVVKVKREELLAKVKANRDNHRAIFEEALSVYRERMVQELDSMLADARAGRKIRRSVSLPEPEDHTKDYDKVIAMLEMSVDPVIELLDHDFTCYVMDQWEWNRSFAANTLMYSNNGRN